MKQISTYPISKAAAWDKLLLATDSYTIFHSMAWAKVLSETYGFVPSYLEYRGKEGFVLLPFMTVRGPLFGRKAVCLPFSDVCGPVFTDPGMISDFFGYLRDYAKNRGWKSFELHDDHGVSMLSPFKRYYEHVLNLRNDPEEILRSIRSSTRRNIQHAEREGVTVELCHSLEAVDEYYKLHCITRKRHGVPPQPKRFFRSIYRHLIKQQSGFVVRARYKGRTVASAVFLHFGTKAVYKFGASLPDRRRLRPNNLVMWEAIKWYSVRGFDSLSLGRTDPVDEGLMQFKNGWGRECRVVHYCRWPPQKADGRKMRDKFDDLVTSWMRKLPVSILRLIGTVGYRFIA